MVITINTDLNQLGGLVAMTCSLVSITAMVYTYKRVVRSNEEMSDSFVALTDFLVGDGDDKKNQRRMDANLNRDNNSSIDGGV